ncbi:hypothetical protein BC834DRAFT_973642, partial [Gloeopeniophorella convolvens]
MSSQPPAAPPTPSAPAAASSDVNPALMRARLCLGPVLLTCPVHNRDAGFRDWARYVREATTALFEFADEAGLDDAEDDAKVREELNRERAAVRPFAHLAWIDDAPFFVRGFEDELRAADALASERAAAAARAEAEAAEARAASECETARQKKAYDTDLSGLNKRRERGTITAKDFIDQRAILRQKYPLVNPSSAGGSAATSPASVAPSLPPSSSTGESGDTQSLSGSVGDRNVCRKLSKPIVLIPPHRYQSASRRASGTSQDLERLVAPAAGSVKGKGKGPAPAVGSSEGPERVKLWVYDPPCSRCIATAKKRGIVEVRQVVGECFFTGEPRPSSCTACSKARLKCDFSSRNINAPPAGYVDYGSPQSGPLELAGSSDEDARPPAKSRPKARPVTAAASSASAPAPAPARRNMLVSNASSGRTLMPPPPLPSASSSRLDDVSITPRERKLRQARNEREDVRVQLERLKERL